MSLILKDNLKKFLCGYPTVSDKYNVQGGILTGDTPIGFGQALKFTGTPGYYEAMTEISKLQEFAGPVLATNVQLANGFPGTASKVQPNEALNVMLNGFIALPIALADGQDMSDILPNSPVGILLATGEFTLYEAPSTGDATAIELPSYSFTGLAEMQGDVLLAEVYIK